MIRSQLAIGFFLCCALTAPAVFADPPTDEVLDRVQARLDTFRVRDDGRHHTPKPDESRKAAQKLRENLEAQLAALDAREIQSTGVLRLTALVLRDDDLKVIAQLTGVRSLMLARCTISAEGFAYLAEAWKDSLTQLGLSYVDVQGDGSIADAAAKLDKLDWLTVNATDGIGIDAIQAVSEHPIEMLDMNRLPKGIDPLELLQLLENKFAALRALDLHHWKGLGVERKALYANRPEVKKGSRFDRFFGKRKDSEE